MIMIYFHCIRATQDYEWRPWFVIDDYLERNEPQSVQEQGFKSSIVDSTTDHSCKNNLILYRMISVNEIMQRNVPRRE